MPNGISLRYNQKWTMTSGTCYKLITSPIRTCENANSLATLTQWYSWSMEAFSLSLFNKVRVVRWISKLAKTVILQETTLIVYHSQSLKANLYLLVIKKTYCNRPGSPIGETIPSRFFRGSNTGFVSNSKICNNPSML